MSTVYSGPSSQWPLLQAKTEQKFKSGLFNVSAEFIRPVGNTDLPTVIETSIGTVDVWPEPTVSTGTDGFERINATAYGLWSSNAQETKLNLNPDRVRTIFTNNSNVTVFGDRVGLIFETAACKITRNVGDTNVPVMPVMNIYNYNGTPVTQINLADVLGSIGYNPGGNFSWPSSASIVKRHYISNISLNSYGSVEEVEFIFEIVAEATFFAIPN
jgi:hypothetical protein